MGNRLTCGHAYGRLTWLLINIGRPRPLCVVLFPRLWLLNYDRKARWEQVGSKGPFVSLLWTEGVVFLPTAVCTLTSLKWWTLSWNCNPNEPYPPLHCFLPSSFIKATEMKLKHWPCPMFSNSFGARPRYEHRPGQTFGGSTVQLRNRKDASEKQVTQEACAQVSVGCQISPTLWSGVWMQGKPLPLDNLVEKAACKVNTMRNKLKARNITRWSVCNQGQQSDRECWIFKNG